MRANSPSRPERCLGRCEVSAGYCPPDGNVATCLESVRGKQCSDSFFRKMTWNHHADPCLPARGTDRLWAGRGGDVHSNLIYKSGEGGSYSRV